MDMLFLVTLYYGCIYLVNHFRIRIIHIDEMNPWYNLLNRIIRLY